MTDKLPEDLQKQLDGALHDMSLAGWRVIQYRLRQQLDLVGQAIELMQAGQSCSQPLFDAMRHHKQTTAAFSKMEETWNAQVAATEAK